MSVLICGSLAFDTSTNFPGRFAQHANRLMQAQVQGGCIVFIGSISALRSSPGTAAYGAAKAGLINLTQSVASEYGRYGIRCNAVLPAFVLTPHSVEGLTRHGWTPSREELEKTGVNNVPMGRLGSAQDVANAVLFLSSDEAGFITGLEVPVDGGVLTMVGRYSKPAATAKI